MSFPRLTQKAQNFILNKSWEKLFDSARLKRGQTLAANYEAFLDNIVVDIDRNCFAFFTVTGSYAYEVELTFDRNKRFYSFCDCADDDKCKHIAAALYTLERHVLETAPQAELKQLKPAPVVSLESWLEQLAEAATPAQTTKDLEDEFAPNYKERVVYLLGREQDYEPLAIYAYKGRQQKDGSFKITAHSVKFDYREHNKPKFMTHADLGLLQKISSAAERTFTSTKVPSSSRQFVSILMECLATGRLILEKDASIYDRSTTYTPLEVGGERSMVPTWVSAANDALKPVIIVEPQPDEIIDSTPKVYIDRTRHCIGKLKMHHSEAFIEQWCQGPEVPKSELGKVQQWIEQQGNTAPSKQITPEAAIPKLPEQQSLTQLTPTAHLNIGRVDAKDPSVLRINNPVANVLTATLQFSYDGHLVPAFPFSETFTVTPKGVILTISRNKKLEDALLAVLSKHGPAHKLTELYPPELIASTFSSALAYSENDELNTQQWVGFISSQVPVLESQGWEITIGELDYTLLDYEDFYETISQTRSKSAWFRFDLGIEYNGEKISLIPALAAAIASGMYDGYDFDPAGGGMIAIPLEKKNTFINFPAKRFELILRRLQDIFQHVAEDGHIHLPQLRAASLIDDLDLDKHDSTLSDLARLGSKIKNITGLPKTRVPKNLKAELRDYQIEGFRWLQFLARHHLHGVLADDMGLGKTIQTLTHILAEKNGKRNNKLPTLVVAPTSVIPNWRAEAAKFTPSLKVLLLQGHERHAYFSEIKSHDIILTSYALLHRDQAVHCKQHYHIVVLDESQYIKNAAAKTSKVAYKLQANQRICLSGTPMENHLGELWSVFHFLMPGLLQSNKEFTSTFRTPIERHDDTAKQISLNRRVGPLILRRTKDVVAKELPPKTHIPHYITLDEAQTDLYESVRASMDERVRDAVKAQGFSKSQIIILDALLKLRQICCHPQLLKLKQAQDIQTSAKLDYLTGLLETLLEEGRRILIFSQFTTMLELIEEQLRKQKVPYAKLTGATRDREAPIQKFQEGKVPVFLISLKAGGTGLNLTAADTVIHYDPWWNPAAENQATDRAYRIGQDKPVFVHRLICQGTIEEHIQKLQEQKSQLVESLLSGSTNKLTITTETLNGLLAPLD